MSDMVIIIYAINKISYMSDMVIIIYTINRISYMSFSTKIFSHKFLNSLKYPYILAKNF